MRASFICTALLIFATSVFALDARASFEFAPILANLSPTGSGATTTYQVTNSSDQKVPIQITIFGREPDLKGEEVYKESDAVSDQFKIFPSQLVLGPHETRAVRVSWMGPKKLVSELSFRIIAEELPVDLEDPDKKIVKAVARLNISTRYVGSLFVTPQGATSKITADAKPIEKDSRLLLTVKNDGTAHQVLKAPVLKIHSEKKDLGIEMSGRELGDLVNQNVLAGRSRQFQLKMPKNLPDGPIKVSLEFSKDQ